MLYSNILKYFSISGYEILDPSSGRVLPSAYNKGNRGRVTFAPPITDVSLYFVSISAYDKCSRQQLFRAKLQ